MIRRRRWLLFTGITAGVLALLFGAAVYTANSPWFQQKLRQSFISRLERSTGARVEVDFFRFDWRTLTVDLKTVVFHGSEPPGGLPLFVADRVRAEFKLASFLDRRFDLESLEIQRPEIHLIVRPDGSTNLPGRKSAMQNLIALRVHRLAIQDGGLQLNLRRIPLRLRGQDVTARCRYNVANAAYDIHFSSKNTELRNSDSVPLPASVDGRLRLEKTRLRVETLKLATGDSNVTASGTIANFADPSADFHFSAAARAKDAAAFLHSTGWRDGEVVLEGSGHYGPGAGVTFHGNIAGRKLSYYAGSTALSGVDFDSDLVASRDRLHLPNFVLTAPGAKVSGSAELEHLKALNVTARIDRFDLRRAALILFHRTIPFASRATGRFHYSGGLTGQPSGLLTAELNLAPAPGGTPASGHLNLDCRIPMRALQFRESQLNLPATRLSFSGAPNAALQVVLDSTDLNEAKAAISFFRPSGITTLPMIDRNGNAHFDGTVVGLTGQTRIEGDVALSNFEFKGKHWDQFRSRVSLTQASAEFSSLTAASGALRANGSARVELANWAPTDMGQVRLKGHFQGVDTAPLAAQVFTNEEGLRLSGIASGSVDLSGTRSDPVGKAELRIDSPQSSGLHLNYIQVDATLDPYQVRFTRGRMQSGPAVASFSGTYTHHPSDWRAGRLAIKIDSNGFPLASIAEWRQRETGINANAEIHAQGTFRIASGRIEPATADGVLNLRNIALGSDLLGSLRINAVTLGNVLKANLAGDFQGHPITCLARVQLEPGNPMNGELHFDRLAIAVLRPLLNPERGDWRFHGTATGSLVFNGPLLQPARWRGRLQVDGLEIRSRLPESGSATKTAGLVFHNAGPIVINAADGTATLRDFQISGKDTALNVKGSFRYDRETALDVHLNGSVNLQILQLLDPSFQSSGHAAIAADIGGTAANPAINGTLDIARGTFFLANLPNGLSAVNGRISFNRNRATIQSLTAETGGGRLALSGFVNFGSPGPLVYHVQANADNVRLRYAGGISVTTNADLRLTGSSQNSILSGTATVSRIIFNPNTDVGNVLAAFDATAAAPANTNEFVNGLHLDVAIQSAPNLQLSTELSRDVEAEIEIRLRGTPDHPVLLGSIAANQGDIKVFGTKYSINRGEVSFRNSARIEPVLDLDLQTRTRGITVNITISGTMERLNIAYRSDPPLQPRDIVALLTVGRAPETSTNVRSVQTSSDVTTVRSNASTVLGQAVSPSPGRLSKLFGITNVKIDPMVQGIITNTPQARLTLEQQVSRDLTVTYVTNLSQTAEQIFRVEWALNRQYSLVAVRDENGEFGIDIQYKKRFR